MYINRDSFFFNTIQTQCDKMAQRMFDSSANISGLHWNRQQNSIALKSFRSANIKKEKNGMKIEFLDDCRKKCRLYLSTFNKLCNLRDSIMQISSVLKAEKNENECQQKAVQQEEFEQQSSSLSSSSSSSSSSNATALLESLLKMTYAKSMIAC